MKYNKFIALICFTVALYSCKKEATTWETDWAAPIASGHLTINDMLPVTYTETNAGGYLSLVIHESIFEFSIDTLIQLPDTTISVKTAIGIPSIEVTPLFSLPDNYDQSYDLGEIELKRVIIESGTAKATIQSPWQGKTKITFTFPNVTSPGGLFERIYYLEAGSISELSEVEDLINMAYYTMDLTGSDGNLFNTLGINVLIESNETESSFIVTNSDSITFSFSFNELVPRYAKGYFGQYRFTDTTGVSLAPLKKVVAGSFDLDSIALKLTIKNGFNILAQSKITKLTGINTRTSNVVEVDFPEKGMVMNINPASGGYYDYVPSEFPILIDNSNSNFIDFLENLSDSVLIGYDLKINPFGNTTAGSDELFPDSKMELFLDGEFPLEFGANDLMIEDTLTIDWFEAGAITPKEAVVYLNYVNGFPIGAEAKFYLLDSNDVLIDSIVGTSPIVTGSYDAGTYLTTPHSGLVEFHLTSTILMHLEETKQLLLRLEFNSDESSMIKISPSTFFDFTLHTNLQIRVSI